MMLHIPCVLTREQVSEMRRRLDESQWIDGRATVGEQGAKVKQNRQLPESSPLALELGQTILTALATHPLYFSAVLPLRTIPPLFNSYAGGEHYGAHVDGSMRRIPGSGEWVRTDVSTTVFLCDPDEYDGGELIVTDAYGEHEVKLPAGDAIIYPSTSIHRVEPVTRGARVCSFFWTQSMVRDDMRRGMLLELDQNIQSLRARLGDCPEMVGITGHYHNLLRQWSEV
ncbi:MULTISPECIES: Fe2+-dependent dioxygenase [unclassified Duganella]|uniref:Fe2+-dependent dioxygenase n=1 Tax=unclassified Duganella TaxID=2636909 RepID=UPI00088DB6FA|nr:MULTISPECIES: Fe2+-dependent dioxygenase [unclassified Duganella]SDH28684.1 PKHD-type hydroxylase [Duganella sp. OV458]SDK38550.1 PKHD-type hydroxylase [Duganella sp. OV510]